MGSRSPSPPHSNKCSHTQRRTVSGFPLYLDEVQGNVDRPLLCLGEVGGPAHRPILHDTAAGEGREPEKGILVPAEHHRIGSRLNKTQYPDTIDVRFASQHGISKDGRQGVA